VFKAVPSPLLGKRIVFTRAESQTAELVEKLTARGALSLLLPLLSFAPPDDYGAMDSALASLDLFDWIFFTSANAVRAVSSRYKTLGQSWNTATKLPRIAAVGRKTAEELAKAGLPVDYVAKKHSGAALAEELGPELSGHTILLPRSDRANADLPEALRRQGARPTELPVYRTLPASEVDQGKLRDLLNGQADALLFFSPSAVHHFTDLLGRERLTTLADKLTILALGPVTAGALRKASFQHILVAEDTTADGVITTLEKHFAGAATRFTREAIRP